MKRYWVFAGNCYYPGGGMRDFVNDFDTLEEAVEVAQKSLQVGDEYYWDWAQVYDSQERKGVTEYGDNHGFESVSSFPA